MGEAAIDVEKIIDQERKDGAVVFLPSAIVPDSFYKPVVEKIWLIEDDIYNSQGKFRISFGGLLKLSNAAGIEWSPIDSGRTDNGSDKLYVSHKAVGCIRKADGKLYPTAANYDLDLELIQEELEEQYQQKASKMNNKNAQEKEDYVRYCVKRDWFQKRKHKATLAESGAKARVIRAILGLQSQYGNKQDLIGRPFVMVRFILDHQNPDIKQTLLSAARENMSSIYGGGSLPQALPVPLHETADVIDCTPAPEKDTSEDIPFEQHGSTENNQELDFQNSDTETQAKTLEALCKKTGYDLQGFLNQVGKPLVELSEKKRLEFFQFLNGN